MYKKLRPFASIAIILATLLVGWHYFTNHRALLTQLTKTPLYLTALVFALYIIMFGILVLILDATLRICNKQISLSENILLNGYSILINFLVPGQAGPAFRGVYLYKRHKLKASNYIAVTLLYYLFYGIIGIFLILAGSKPLWLTAAGSILMIVAAWVLIRLYVQKTKVHTDKLDLSRFHVSLLLGWTFAQALLQIVIYWTELHFTNHSIRFHQVITYTGVADLALFVGLTPAAIGVREAFLVFTQSLHHIKSTNIVVANVIDRAVYLVFIAASGILAASLHAKDRLHITDK